MCGHPYQIAFLRYRKVQQYNKHDTRNENEWDIPVPSPCQMPRHMSDVNMCQTNRYPSDACTTREQS